MQNVLESYEDLHVVLDFDGINSDRGIGLADLDIVFACHSLLAHLYRTDFK